MLCRRRTLAIALVFLAAASAAHADSSSKKERSTLFDGTTLEGWTTLSGKKVEKGWEVVDGTIHRASRGGDIITKEQFGDFDLRFEWKISKLANSGLKYKFKRFDGKWLGCEYQVLDDGRGEAKNTKHSAGALYDIISPGPKKKLRPLSEFNSSRIRVRGSRIEHWLNGEKVVDVDTASEEWTKLVGKSKFRKVEGFGKNRLGHIMLQDHGGEVWFRNITIVKLDGRGGE